MFGLADTEMKPEIVDRVEARLRCHGSGLNRTAIP